MHRMTPGEKRLAERLEQKLDDDYMLWYDVPVGPKQTHPDFVIIHPRRGLLILETKDWHLETIKKATREYWEIAPDGKPKVVINPLAQARHCAIQVVNALERDAQLIHSEGPHQGKLAFPQPGTRPVRQPDLCDAHDTHGRRHGRCSRSSRVPARKTRNAC